MALNTEGIIGQSSSLRDLFKVITKVAPTDSTVLVTGESGTGKEVLVRALHLPLPGALAGMLLLFGALVLRGNVPAPLASTSGQLLQHLMLLLVPAYWGHHQGSAALLGLVPALLAQLLLAWLLGYLLAVLTAALRDVAQMMGFLLSIGVFAAPILFPLTMFPERWRGLLWLNPMTAWVLVYQSVLLQGQWPAPAVWLAMALWLCVLALLLELALRRCHDQLVDWL